MRHNQNDDSFYHSDGLPSRLLIHHTILRSKRKFIEKYLSSFLEPDSMLANVRRSFPLIPFEEDHVIIIVTLNM